MNGTTSLDLYIIHDANVNFITGNGFAVITYYGAKNVLIDERAVFNFIENYHACIPMWNTYGDFVVNEGTKVFVLNTFAKTSSDNYNIYFKGQNPRISEAIIKAADNRTLSTNWKLYASILVPLKSKENFTLLSTLFFKKNDNSIITLSEVPSLVYTNTSSSPTPELHKLTYGMGKGILLDLTDKYLKANEEYQPKIIWNIEE